MKSKIEKIREDLTMDKINPDALICIDNEYYSVCTICLNLIETFQSMVNDTDGEMYNDKKVILSIRTSELSFCKQQIFMSVNQFLLNKLMHSTSSKLESLLDNIDYILFLYHFCSPDEICYLSKNINCSPELFMILPNYTHIDPSIFMDKNSRSTILIKYFINRPNFDIYKFYKIPYIEFDDFLNNKYSNVLFVYRPNKNTIYRSWKINDCPYRLLVEEIIDNKLRILESLGDTLSLNLSQTTRKFDFICGANIIKNYPINQIFSTNETGYQSSKGLIGNIPIMIVTEGKIIHDIHDIHGIHGMSGDMGPVGPISAENTRVIGYTGPMIYELYSTHGIKSFCARKFIFDNIEEDIYLMIKKS